jgi:PAS domain S-box-containing protein
MARIVIVEDETIVARSIKDTLQKFGHTVCGIAATGDDALAIVSREQPDLVFMDVKLRGTMDGVEAAYTIMTDHDIPVIFMTAHSDDETIRRIKETYPYGYILKPFEPNDLRLAIEIGLFRHSMVKQLRQSEERYRFVSETVSDFAMLYRISPDNSMEQEWVTDAFDHITGYSWAERNAHGGWLRLCRPTELPRVQEQLSDIISSGEPGVIEAEILRKDGEYRWLRAYFRPVWDKNHSRVERLVGAGKDITAEKHHQEKFEQEINFRRAIESSMGAGVVAVDTKGRQIYVNPEFAEMLGWPAEELLDAMPPFVYWPESEISRISETFNHMLSGNAPKGGSELTFRRRNGTRIDVLVTSSALKDGTGHPMGWLAVVYDNTERKKTEEALRRSQRMESIARLAGGVAHDFNNLLVAMLGQTSLALSRLEAGHPVRINLERAVRAGERAADLTRQLLAYAGGGKLESKPLDLNQLVTDSLQLLYDATGHGSHIFTDLADSLPLIKADPSQMQQILLNLVTNSSESIGENSGRIIITTGVQMITETDTRFWNSTGEPLRPGPYVALEIHDNGAGMDTATLEKIFDPFFSTKFTGRGLGLPAVLGIVRAHHGGLAIDSAPDQGTNIRVVIPALTAAGHPGEKTLPNIATPHKAILLIDDDESVREAVADVFDSESWPIVTVSNGATGVQIYRERQNDVELVILDYAMPGMNGKETLQRLRQINPDVRVVLTSGYTEEDIIDIFEGIPYVGFMQKPYPAHKLIEQVRHFLSV